MRKFKTAFGGPVVDFELMLVAFVTLQCCLPLATAVKIGADEGYEPSKAVLCLNGHRLYTEVWSVLPKNWDTSLPVVVGIVLLFRRAGPRRSLAWLPLAWMGLTLAILSLNRILDLPVRWLEGPESRVNVWRTVREDLAGMRRLRHSLRRLERQNPVRLQTPSCLRA